MPVVIKGVNCLKCVFQIAIIDTVKAIVDTKIAPNDIQCDDSIMLVFQLVCNV